MVEVAACYHPKVLHRVRVSASDPYPASSNGETDRRSIGPEAPSSPRENKRKKFQHEISSPNVFSRNKHGRHSLVIEAPIIPHSPVIAWDSASNHEMKSKSQTDSCSLNSSSSRESLLEPDEKCLTKIHHIIHELISTEKNYIKDLMDILGGYLDPMIASDMFSEQLLQDIFINIREIGSFHIEFLELLDKHQQELDSLANCFLSDSADKGFSLYTEFCAKVPSSLDIVEDLMTVEEKKNFLVQCQHNLHHFFQFSEFLHRPIQRVLKYPLLLRDLVKYTSGTRYWRTVEAALERITAVAVHINKVKRVQELNSNELVGWIGEPLLSYGILLLEDLFRINGSRDGRHIFLFEKLFLITKKKDGKYQYKSHLCPSEIAMTENLHGEQCKWEVFKFGDKKNKHVIHASDPKKKQAWVREIKRCILESETELSPQQREILLNEVPTLVNNDFMLDDFILQNYRGLIPVCPVDPGFNQTVPETPDSNTPENRNSPQVNSPLQAYLSPTNTPSPGTRQTPSPDAQHNNDSGFEDPTPQNQVDYSSLDVKAIKARWILQEKTNTVPCRSRPPLDFHRNSTEKKPETWPCPEKSSRVSALKDTFNKTPSPPPSDSVPECSVSSDPSQKVEVSTKPCLARISHIGNEKEKKSPVYRDIKSLIEADAANLQQPELKPEPMPEPVPEPQQESQLQSVSEPITSYDLGSDNNKTTIYRNSVIEMDGVLKPSSAAEKKIDKVQKIEHGIGQHNYSANINMADKSDKSDELVHSKSEDFVVKFRKNCNINDTDTTKRNSTIIDKDFSKDMKLFSPCSSDSDCMSDKSETSARVERIKNVYERSKRKQKKAPRLEKSDTETTLELDSLTDLIDQFDGEMTKARESPEKVEYDEFVDKFSAHDIGSTSSSNVSLLGIAGVPESVDDKTLTKKPSTLTKKIDDSTLTKGNTSYIYTGSSLIIGSLEDGSDEIVMKPENPRGKDKPAKQLSKLQAPAKTSKFPVETTRKSTSCPKESSRRNNNTLSSTDDEEQPGIMKPKRPTSTTKSNSRTVRRTKSDTTDEDVEPKKSSKTRKPAQNLKSPTSTLLISSSNTSALQKSSSNKSIKKSSSSKSIQKSPSGTQIRDRSKSNTMSCPKPTTTTTTTKTRAPSNSRYSKPTASSAAKTTTKLPARTPSFNQDDNPFSTQKTALTQKTSAPKSRPKAARSLPQPVTTAEKPRTIRSTSDSNTRNRQTAYLNAAAKTKTKKVSESEQDVVELNSIRSSALVSKMKTQLQKSNADLK